MRRRNAAPTCRSTSDRCRESCPSTIETAVFRLVEYALDSTDGGRLRASIEEAQEALRIGIAMEQPAPAVLLALRTRAESLGGATQVVPPDGRAMTLLRVTLPLS